MKEKVYVAVDLGASSGRVIAGKFDGRKIELEELSRFEHCAEEIDGGFYWKIPKLWNGVLDGLKAIKNKIQTNPSSVGIDSWAVDFVLIDETGFYCDEEKKVAVSYRDPRTDGMIEEALKILPRFDIFKHSGLQFMQFNTLFQLLALKKQKPEVLAKAKSFLMIPDLFNRLLCGEEGNEFTNATTTQLFDPTLGEWSDYLFDKFELPREIFHTPKQPFTDLGKINQKMIAIDGLADTHVILPGTHDTASSVFSVPASGKLGECDWCYISLGTWALIGVESLSPIMSQEVYDLNFTNEGGVGGTTRVLKNVAGLWLLQECKRIWQEQGHNLSWQELNNFAQNSEPLRSLINPNHHDFLCPTNMPDTISAFCENTNQYVPKTVGEIIRCAIDSIAVRLWQAFEMCEQITGKNIKTIHIVGGGSKNNLLCQAIADATSRQVIAGPVESTAIGNIMCQAIALGDVANIEQAREIIRNSFTLTTFNPNNQNKDKWKEASELIKKLRN
ncbi:MAG: rhamnulokinase [Planctomycetaceae bacterium]|jgi:rhamnulokinase|nr:rhamnulokinase [Planctomycetaceae bacterium]